MTAVQALVLGARRWAERWWWWALAAPIVALFVLVVLEPAHHMERSDIQSLSIVSATAALALDLLILTPLAALAAATGAVTPLPRGTRWLAWFGWRGLIRVAFFIGNICVLPGFALAVAFLYLESSLAAEPQKNPLAAAVSALVRRPSGVLVWLAANLVNVGVNILVYAPFVGFVGSLMSLMGVPAESRVADAISAVVATVLWSLTWSMLAALYVAPVPAKAAAAPVDLREAATANPFAPGG